MSSSSMLMNDTDTTVPSYWLNWRFFVCAIWIVVAMVLAALIIWRNEGRKKTENQKEAPGCLYDDEVWGTCWKAVHPYWLLAFRLTCFVAMVALIIVDVMDRGVGIFYFYTQWTFTLVAIYFGLASGLSISGCLSRRQEIDPLTASHDSASTEQGFYVPPMPGANQDLHSKTGISSVCDQEDDIRPAASGWGYTLQIIFQVSAGATVLTDSVFWLLLYPFFAPAWYRLTFIIVCKHALNAVFLIGDTCLGRLRFPFFRIAYFVLFTLLFVVAQWIMHAFVSYRWPYPFLDLVSPLAPAWYIGVSVLHLPCFVVFSLVFRLKRHIMSR